MVLQRNREIKLYGWADSQANVTVTFLDSVYHTRGNSNGEWELLLAAQPAGGPYGLQVTAGDSTCKIDNIWLGDVWFCSGQSNMELSMRRVSWVYPEIIANSENPQIRQFYVPRDFYFKGPREDLPGGVWKAANPENVLDFSATAYFFAREVYDRYKVPIGIINSALGGSPVESWLSENALQEFPDAYQEYLKFQSDSLIAAIRQEDQKRQDTWYRELYEKDAGRHDPKMPWTEPGLDDSDWLTMQIPGTWDTTLIGKIDGVVWFRKNVDIPQNLADQPATLVLGRIVDADSVYVNGTFVGTTGYQYPPRRYPVPAGLLHAGVNSLVVRIINSMGSGGFMPEKPYELEFDTGTIDLKGAWHCKLGATMPFLLGQTFIRWKPGGLYNAMVAPLLNYNIKGVVWYQGEANAVQPVKYRARFAALIEDWRNKWQQPDLPFLYVQLPNYMEAKDQPSESNWAQLRQSQLETLALPHTGMAVAIDIGEWNDIHPLDKKDVGHRLALNAFHIAYGDTGFVYSGPIYDSMQVKGNKIILSFTHTGDGLVASGDGTLHEFAICGKDRKFVWAKAIIDGDKIVVWNDSIDTPVAVRYAWADNPDKANLYNAEGLPASPFTTEKTDAK